MISEEKRQNALKCLARAKEYLAAGNLDASKRMAEKSKRFHPNAEADQILSKIKAKKTAAESTERNSQRKTQGENSSGAKKASSRRSESQAGEPVKRYSVEQERIVKLVRRESDYYKLLKIERRASKEVVTKAFRKLAIKCHPDKNPHPKAEDAFKKLNAIKDVLTDPGKRRTYDQFGEEGVTVNGGGGRYAHHRQQGGFTEEDIFSMFFEGGVPRSRRRRQRHQGQQRQEAPASFVQLLQFAPLLILFLFSAVSGPGAEESPFSLERSGDFPVARVTPLGTPYWVRYEFYSRYGRDARAMYTIEEMADTEYFNKMQQQCYAEKKRKENAIYDAERDFSRGVVEEDETAESVAERLRQAHALQTPSCIKINAILDARAG
mmetsp:Transcript_24764/g.44056  ORF Transcript_24764/g.44056 Transcript_24764/m.44056 type:complete len:379 (-) Transcript_24764:134-1270(-)|eukprot:CAMPEP_0197524018 /NCGR_PEP_ID=MMETSP1318-20131121/8806_1 /TAXON_ID=552666 /ORGANISM="Partenskyella glossopodia, Strain RCC365" /LENGTH=378 /DNA_ID=CAMNT_0043076861 /DNA_START=39 /DNA_END=1175 /DNA_ORIENTATION=-